MTKEECIFFIRDEMLINPNIDASLAYEVSNKALFDEEMYKLMISWMEKTSDTEKYFIEMELEERLLSL